MGYSEWSARFRASIHLTHPHGAPGTRRARCAWCTQPDVTRHSSQHTVVDWRAPRAALGAWRGHQPRTSLVRPSRGSPSEINVGVRAAALFSALTKGPHMCRPGAVALRAGRVHASRALHCGGVGSPGPRDVARFGTGRRVKPAKAATAGGSEGREALLCAHGNRHAIDVASKRLPRTGFPFRKGPPWRVQQCGSSSRVYSSSSSSSSTFASG